ncbi:MAG: agmatine deiminase family protein [Bacteroidales bacterium]|nr:agmatine deiminase family protein [Bacteroidales bacterium]
MKRFPAEWERQACVQLTWPHRETDFADVYDRAVACFVNIAREISKREKLIIVCKSKQNTIDELGEVMNGNISFVEADTNDVWARDHGAITVFEDGKPVLYDFTFNGWGQKFPAEKDNAITLQLYQSGVFKSAEYRDMSHFVLEGGSIETDGRGVLLTTESCLLSKYRNPSLSKSDIEQFLTATFGVQKVLWLSHGELAGDDTDGHIDTLARLVSEDTIAYVECGDANDVHYHELQAMKRELEAFTTLDGRPYNLVPLPMATPAFDADGKRIPATYANFLIMNDAVLLPVYNCETDAQAINTLQKIFPDKEIVPIDCSVLILQHGSLHCVTMQYPEGVF